MKLKDMPVLQVNNDGHLYSVGEVCSLTGVTRKTLFYYDKIGLLKPTERSSVQQSKLYNTAQFNRLEKILTYRNAGLSIKEIKAILDDDNADHLQIMENALKRLEQEKKDKEEEINRLHVLIDIEKGETCKFSMF